MGDLLTCAGCGLLCDDVTIEHAGDAVHLQPPCPLGTTWLSDRLRRPAGAPAATIDDEPVDLETALARAAELLRAARSPLLYGFGGATVEDARAAVAFADRLGAMITTEPLAEARPGGPAIALRGASSATLGEIRDRARVIVIWREDPVSTHPRLLERLGAGETALVVVDDRDTGTARRARMRLRFSRERDLEALTYLHGLHRGLALRASDLGADLGALLERLTAVPHAAFVYGPGLTGGAGGQRRELALHELVRALCHDRHVVTLGLPRAAGCRSAEDVLAWQTGYARSVELASGHPELISATRPLENIDVALRIEGAARESPESVAEIALCSLPATRVEVSIRTAAAGVEATGTAHRLDGVPLALQAPMAGDAPTAAALLRRLLAEIGTAG